MKAAPALTPDLFAFDFSDQAIQPGDIVRQSWPWICCNRGTHIMPFWQVQFIRVEGARRLYHCMAVPYGVGAGDIHVFSEDDLERTGRSWRIPTDAELQDWFRDMGTTLYLARIENRPLSVHPAEAELAALVASLGPVMLPNRRADWYAQFPPRRTT